MLTATHTATTSPSDVHHHDCQWVCNHGSIVLLFLLRPGRTLCIRASLPMTLSACIVSGHWTVKARDVCSWHWERLIATRWQVSSLSWWWQLLSYAWHCERSCHQRHSVQPASEVTWCHFWPYTFTRQSVMSQQLPYSGPVTHLGLTEFAGVDKAARSKMGVWKMQEWTHRHDIARVDNAGVDNSAPCCRDGICRSGQISTMLREWTMQEWTMRHHVAGVDNAGVDNAVVVKCLWKMSSRQAKNHRLYVRSTHMRYQLTVVGFVLWLNGLHPQTACILLDVQ